MLAKMKTPSDEFDLKYALQLVTANQADDAASLVKELVAQDIVERGTDAVIDATMGLLGLNKLILLLLSEATGQPIPELLATLGATINKLA